jgi:hypothetical protein
VDAIALPRPLSVKTREEISYPALHAEGHAVRRRALECEVKVTKENVEHHIEEEEGPMFREVRLEFSKDELEELGSRINASKQEQMKEAMPERDQVNL